MKKILCIAFFGYLAIPCSSYAFGAFVFDPMVCAKLGSEALQLEQQLSILKEQLLSIKPSIETLKPHQYQWSSTKGVIGKLGTVIGASKGLSYSASNISQQFKAAYPGYTASQNYDEQYQTSTTKTLGTLNGVLNSLHESANNFEQEHARLSFLQSQERSAVGQTQAIQAGAQIASEEVSQLQLLRQNIMAQTSAQNAFYASQLQAEASQRAEMKKMVLAGSVNAKPIGYSGHAIDLTAFTPRP